jgi:hypothetical protein
MCSYGQAYGLKYGLYCAINKNTDELYFEIVELDWNHGTVNLVQQSRTRNLQSDAAAEDRANRRVLRMQNVPPFSRYAITRSPPDKLTADRANTRTPSKTRNGIAAFNEAVIPSRRYSLSWLPTVPADRMNAPFADPVTFSLNAGIRKKALTRCSASSTRTAVRIRGRIACDPGEPANRTADGYGQVVRNRQVP